MKRRNKQKSTLARSVVKFLCIVLGLMLTVMIAVTAYFQYLMGHINFVDPEDIRQMSQEELDAYLATENGSGLTGPSLNSGDVSFENHSTTIGGRGSSIVNILLIGQDRREGESGSRSDSILLCTFNRRTNQIIMTSFLRDLYVQIPGYRSNRINAAYAAGGMTLLDETLQQNFGVHIDGNVEVDFEQFAQVIDLLGGVEIELRQDEADLINEELGSSLTQGVQRLNGSEALCYARIRKLDADGDFSRTSRQRKVMAALISAYRDASLPEAASLMKKLLPMITTDMSGIELLSYALEMFPMLSQAQFVSQHVPAAGTYTNQNIDGMAVLVADLDASRQMLEQTLLGE